MSKRSFIIELAVTLGGALAISALIGFYIDGKMNWTMAGVTVLLGLVLVCVPRLVSTLRPPRKVLENLNTLAEKNRLELIQRLGWYWEAREDMLCKLDKETGELIERIDRRTLTEVWGINTDEGPWLEDFWFLVVCGEKEYSIGSELFTDDILSWFFALVVRS